MADDDRTRQRVLEAAGPLFAARGFDAVSVREITERAGTNVASVNYYFGGKEALYVETVRHAAALAEQHTPHPPLVPGQPPEDRLREFIRAFLTRVLGQEKSGWHRDLIFREVADPRPGACEGFVEHFVRPSFELLVGLVRDLAAPEVPADRLRMMAGSVIGQMLHYHHCRHILTFLAGKDWAETHTIDVLTDHVHRFSLAAIRGYRTGERP